MAKNYQGRPDRHQTDKIVYERIEDLSALNGRDIDHRARATARALVRADRLKTHQLRNIYASVDELRTLFKAKKAFTPELESRLYLLQPQIAYAAGRQTAVNATLFPFFRLLIEGVEAADDKTKAVQNFFALVESVVGYHKFYENVRDAE